MARGSRGGGGHCGVKYIFPWGVTDLGFPMLNAAYSQGTVQGIVDVMKDELFGGK